jgi:hypothetical protein
MENNIHKIGDMVIDAMIGGVFIIEEIREEDNWVWGSKMKVPYCKEEKKNFMDPNFAWKQ